jgi:hypothetical protein
MGVNASIEGSNPSFSASFAAWLALTRSLALTGETVFPPFAPFFIDPLSGADRSGGVNPPPLAMQEDS